MVQRILLADDHAVVRSGLRILLENAGYQVIAEAESGERACTLWQEHHPDLGILDLDMPGIGGLETLHRIIARDRNARLIIFSMHNDNIYAARSMQAGARGYVVKTDAPEILLEAVKQVLRGGRYIGHELAQHLAMDRFSPSENPLEKLSPREFEVFRRIAEGISLSGIAEELHIGYKTAANIQTQVRQKLNVQTTGQLVHIAIRFGITQQRD
ncbi:response regulator [Methylobacillus flagellatus]|uniref:Two component transcriptional regulator, LuxR family n=1 Tax=Methylobacillus flagellatus (strain ATCC 51484 / DSM 6875 / VKM B-1610 / KT) TaxID=265072 RepID=Q1H353_METFK|nr:response regulator transcription factor [Methylobacillus flagellatus]ABE49084.1 two component transcriptional regulator, LuxR family [Methylobacillus flagellatus KT]